MTADEIITDIIIREGGLGPAHRHVSDRGGWTRAGITAASAGEYLGLGRTATDDELNALTEMQIRDFYRRRHVMPYDWTTDPLRALLADWSTTSWHDDPVMAVQRALLAQGLYRRQDGSPRAVDGVAGEFTRLAFVQCRDQRRLYRDVLASRLDHAVRVALADDAVQILMRNQPTQLDNLRGWIRRAAEFMLGLVLAALVAGCGIRQSPAVMPSAMVPIGSAHFRCVGPTYRSDMEIVAFEATQFVIWRMPDGSVSVGMALTEGDVLAVGFRDAQNRLTGVAIYRREGDVLHGRWVTFHVTERGQVMGSQRWQEERCTPIGGRGTTEGGS